MSSEAVIVKQSEGERLSVMGAGVKFLCTGDRTGKAWSLMEVALPEGAGPPPHVHPWGEAYYVVSGQVRFSIDGQEQLFGAGDFIYAPAGTRHGFKGATQEQARVLIFDAPAHAESFFREVDREVKGPADMAKVPQIGLRHQIDFRPV
jgi:quercetin dioxygenase-like cupin family protein